MTIENPQIVPQDQFVSLEEFINRNNNFYAKLMDSRRGEKNQPYQQRFRKIAPELSKELDGSMTLSQYQQGAIPWEERFPWDKVWEAYKIMSNLVYLGDEDVQGESDRFFLTR